jgi:low affinity Fe/Cu permease
MRRSRRQQVNISRGLEALARRVTEWTGTSWAFASAIIVVALWALSGPYYRFSDTWQLVINTATTVVTFLMVFLIQRSQNKDSLAIHLKLNEVVAALEGASNRLINIEDLTEDEIRILREHYRRLVDIAKRDDSLTRSHSIEEAELRHRAKRQEQEIHRSATGVAAPSASPRRSARAPEAR